jgi:hypothetical protein
MHVNAIFCDAVRIAVYLALLVDRLAFKGITTYAKKNTLLIKAPMTIV